MDSFTVYVKFRLRLLWVLKPLPLFKINQKYASQTIISTSLLNKSIHFSKKERNLLTQNFWTVVYIGTNCLFKESWKKYIKTENHFKLEFLYLSNKCRLDEDKRLLLKTLKRLMCPNFWLTHFTFKPLRNSLHVPELSTVYSLVHVQVPKQTMQVHEHKSILDRHLEVNIAPLSFCLFKL